MSIELSRHDTYTVSPSEDDEDKSAPEPILVKNELLEHSEIDQINCGSFRNDEKPINTLQSIYLKNHVSMQKKIFFVGTLASYSILGESLRICLGRIFGSECIQDTTPWLHSLVTKYNLCVTSNGSSNGGALFFDLPANMLGCFVMGMLQPCQDLHRSENPSGLVFLPDDHWFHEWKGTHFALRAGFCSSLTSFASWNSQMVTMLFGVGITKETGITSQFVASLFGYVLGLEISVASYALGIWVAVWLHRCSNPEIRREDDETENKNLSAPFLNETLPDFEKRFLGGRLDDECYDWAVYNYPCLEHLERWRQSTDHVRAGHRENLLRPVLNRIEKTLLVDDQSVNDDELLVAGAMGWDIDSLGRWNVEKKVVEPNIRSYPWVEAKKSKSLFAKRLLAALPFVTCFTIMYVFVLLDLTHASESAYRAMWLSAISAPMGAFLRCGLSRFNGTLPGKWKWFPLGTFLANMSGSAISITALTLSLNLTQSQNPWFSLVLSAIKTGFAGSLSTVATLVAEGHKLQTVLFPYHIKGLSYMTFSLCSACLISSFIFRILI